MIQGLRLAQRSTICACLIIRHNGGPRRRVRAAFVCDRHARQQSPARHVDDANGWGPIIHLRGISVGGRASQQEGAIEDRFPGDFGAQGGKAPHQKQVILRSSEGSSMHPTGQVVRQKEDRKLREATLLEEGAFPEDIKKARGRRRSQQEDHKYNCGSDAGPQEEVHLVNALVVDGGASARPSHLRS